MCNVGELSLRNYNYEVLFFVINGNSRSSSAFTTIKTDLINGYDNNIISMSITNSNCFYASYSLTLPVGAQRYCRYQISGSKVSSDAGHEGVFALGYKRIGTNS